MFFSEAEDGFHLEAVVAMVELKVGFQVPELLFWQSLYMYKKLILAVTLTVESAVQI